MGKNKYSKFDKNQADGSGYTCIEEANIMVSMIVLVHEIITYIQRKINDVTIDEILA